MSEFNPKRYASMPKSNERSLEEQQQLTQEAEAQIEWPENYPQGSKKEFKAAMKARKADEFGRDVDFVFNLTQEEMHDDRLQAAAEAERRAGIEADIAEDVQLRRMRLIARDIATLRTEDDSNEAAYAIKDKEDNLMRLLDEYTGSEQTAAVSADRKLEIADYIVEATVAEPAEAPEAAAVEEPMHEDEGEEDADGPEVEEADDDTDDSEPPVEPGQPAEEGASHNPEADADPAAPAEPGNEEASAPTQTAAERVEAERERLRKDIKAAMEEAIASIEAVAGDFRDSEGRLTASFPAIEAAIGAAGVTAKNEFNRKSTESSWGSSADGVDRDRREALDAINRKIDDIFNEYKKLAQGDHIEGAPAEPAAPPAPVGEVGAAPGPEGQSPQGGIGVLEDVFDNQNGGSGTHSEPPVTSSPVGSPEQDAYGLTKKQQKRLEELEAMQRQFNVNTIRSYMRQPGFNEDLEKYGKLLAKAKKHMDDDQKRIYQANYDAVIDRIGDLQKPLAQRLGRAILNAVVPATTQEKWVAKWYAGAITDSSKLERSLADRINSVFDSLDGSGQRSDVATTDDETRKQ